MKDLVILILHSHRMLFLHTDKRNYYHLNCSAPRPAVRQSVLPAAENFIKNQGETPKAASYCVKVSDLKSITKIQDKLGESGLSTTIDEKSLTEWKLKSAGITSRIIMRCIAIAAAVCMILLSARLVSYSESPKPKSVYLARVCTVFVIGIIAGVMVDRLVICLFPA